MIKNVVFDMGQVLIHWSPERCLAPFDLSPEDREILLREVFQGLEWIQLDRGAITEEEALDAICCRIPRRLHGVAEDVVTGWWRKALEPVDGMAELIARLKNRGYGIYLLSNAGVSLRRYFRWIPGSEYFDGIMVSSEEKILKPQYELYHTLFRRFDLKPEECFFIDDSPVNVDAAACCGMAGSCFRGDVARLQKEMLAAGLWF